MYKHGTHRRQLLGLLLIARLSLRALEIKLLVDVVTSTENVAHHEVVGVRVVDGEAVEAEVLRQQRLALTLDDVRVILTQNAVQLGDGLGVDCLNEQVHA